VSWSQCRGGGKRRTSGSKGRAALTSVECVYTCRSWRKAAWCTCCRRAGSPSMAASTPGCRAHREMVRVRPGEAALSPPPLLLLRSCDESPERLQ
jgi:hypothetical protein